MRLGVDVGGTFTDLVVLGTHGQIGVGKVRSVPGGVSGELWTTMARVCSGCGEEHGGALLVHGTTVATNALLERTGARVVVVTTAGFEDVLWLGRQERADLYDLSLHHPAPLPARDDVIGVAERCGPSGATLPLATEEIARVVEAVLARRPEAVSVSFLFGFRFPEHERRMADALRAALPDGVPVVAAHEVLPVFREYERFSTVAAEAYLRPKVSGYLERLGLEAAQNGLGALRVMSSNGGTMSVAHARERASSLALSGPAGGVEGARLIGTAVGIRDLLTVDMGGTSADASVILNGAPLAQTAGVVGGVALALPHVLIETVGAGGGSVAWVDTGGALRVGPRSAGADPGPAAYGLGGEDATVTDAAVVLGWLVPEHPLAGTLTLQPELAHRAVAAVARAASLTVERCAQGIVDIATAAMVRALRTVSVERGVDPRSMTLVAFGGAGPLFACRMADSLGMRRALLPQHAGVLSALGLASAPEKLEFVASLHRGVTGLGDADLDDAFRDLETQAHAELAGAGLGRFADCRYEGQGYELTVPATGGGSAVAEAFHATHASRFGHADRARTVEVVNVRVVATRGVERAYVGDRTGEYVPEKGATRVPWESLASGAEVTGPVMLDGLDATARIEAGWRGSVHRSGAVVLERT